METQRRRERNKNRNSQRQGKELRPNQRHREKAIGIQGEEQRPRERDTPGGRHRRTKITRSPEGELETWVTSEKVRRQDSLLLTVGSQHQYKVCAMKRRHSQTEILAELRWAHRSRRGTLEGVGTGLAADWGGGRAQLRGCPPPFTRPPEWVCARVYVLETEGIVPGLSRKGVGGRL